MWTPRHLKYSCSDDSHGNHRVEKLKAFGTQQQLCKNPHHVMRAGGKSDLGTKHNEKSSTSPGVHFGMRYNFKIRKMRMDRREKKAVKGAILDPKKAYKGTTVVQKQEDWDYLPQDGFEARCGK